MVSIIILNFNTFSYTSSCIKSIIDITKETSYEIILVDNASTECDPDLFHKEFPEITLVKNIENRGFSKGCNDGIAVSKGEYILLLNSDTILKNDAIGICYKKLISDKNIGVITCRLENPDGTPQNNCQRFPSFWLSLAEKFRIHKLYSRNKRGEKWLGPYFNYDSDAFPDWIWGTFFMFPKEILEIFPGKKLTETFWMYVEDIEWCWIVRKSGFKVSFIHTGVVIHLHKTGSTSQSVINSINNNIKKFKSIYY